MGNMLLRCILGFVVALVMTLHAGAAGRVVTAPASGLVYSIPCGNMSGADTFASDDQPGGDEQESRAPRKTFCKIDMVVSMDDPDEGAVPAAPLAKPMADSVAVAAIWPVSDKPPNFRNC